MPPLKIERDHVAKRIVALTGSILRVDASLEAGAVAVAPVQYRAIKRHDRLAQPAGAHVGDEIGELCALDQREDFSERMELHHLRISPKRQNQAGLSNPSATLPLGGKSKCEACAGISPASVQLDRVFASEKQPSRLLGRPGDLAFFRY